MNIIKQIKETYFFYRARNKKIEKFADTSHMIHAHVFAAAKKYPKYLRNMIARVYKNNRHFNPEDYSTAKSLYELHNSKGCPVSITDVKVGDWYTAEFDNEYAYKDGICSFGTVGKIYGSGKVPNYSTGRIAKIYNESGYVVLDSGESFNYRAIRPATEDEIESQINEVSTLSID